MRVVVVSCFAYRDCWVPMFALLDKFWPNHPPVTLLTDETGDAGLPERVSVVELEVRASWCRILSAYCRNTAEDFLMVMQEDFFLSAPVQQHLIEHALEQMKERNAGCVRLYPCPGGEVEYSDPYFAIVPRGTQYRVSCMAAIWSPQYLRAIASRFNTPAEFELQGTPFSDTLPDEVLAFKRDVQPWPMEYLCSAIGRGLWSQDAKKLCDAHSIDVDWSLRGFQPA